MQNRDGFLSRWSRLKRDADTAPRPETDTSTTPAPAREQPLPEGKALDELIAELPRIEDLVPGQSLAAFMQPWVPTALRNAALQRMWLLDPAISGYVDPALDYAYDYNALGGAPGFGPMEASEETVRDVAEMFDRALGRTRNAEDDAPSVAPDPPDGNLTADSTSTEMARPPHTTAQSSICALKADAAPQNKPNDQKDLRPVVRRHGGALPS